MPLSSAEPRAELAELLIYGRTKRNRSSPASSDQRLASAWKFRNVQRRSSWPGRGKPVYNFSSDGREFTSGRCLIPADGFYEFTEPTDKKKKRKDKWLFTKKGEPWLCIAGIWRADQDVGEASRC
jgi:putative SOS response-associated peptidase YedK